MLTSTARPCESSNGPSPPTTASEPSDHAEATASTTPLHSTTTPAATDATCASWAPPKSTSPASVRPWTAPTLSTMSASPTRLLELPTTTKSTPLWPPGWLSVMPMRWNGYALNTT